MTNEKSGKERTIGNLARRSFQMKQIIILYVHVLEKCKNL